MNRMITFCDGDLRVWDVLKSVDVEILQTVELVQIFGIDADSAFYITPKDEVFAIGNNLFQRLGIGEVEETTIPVRVNELCGKQVICFATGSTHGMALTESGEVYAWGGNAYGHVGNGSFEVQSTPIKVIFPNGVKIKEIASADRYNLALSVNNELYHWGDIGWNSAPDSYQSTPILLYVPFDVVITSISCGSQHAAAASEKGQVFTWGKIDFRQRRSSDPLEIPTLVSGQLQDQFVVKVTCSCSATLALTDEGILYAWGYNKNSALGTGDTSEILDFPQRVLYMNNIVDIASNNMNQMLCAIAADPETVYTWAFEEENEENSKDMSASKMKHATLHSAYGKRTLPMHFRQKSPLPIEEKPQRQEKTRDIGEALFNKKENSDLTVILSDGEVYAHTLIMKTFSEHFKTLLDENWSKGKNMIDMTQYNPKAYRAFLQYIYTGSLDKLEGQEIIALYDIAVSYFEQELKGLCIKMFNECLTIENVCQLYGAAFGFHSVELLDRCVLYASNHIESIILSKGFESLDPHLCKSLILAAMKQKHNVSH